MSTDFDMAAQRILFNALNGALPCSVFDEVDYLPDGQPKEDFPYVTIGDVTNRAWDNDSTVGVEATATLHIWSKAAGKKEAKTLMGNIYSLLNRQPLAYAGYKVIDCLYEFSNVMDDPDNTTKHGVARYRLTIQEDN